MVGPLKSGAIYTLESWQDRVAVVDGVARAGDRGDT
jgi:hypothetical protein